MNELVARNDPWSRVRLSSVITGIVAYARMGTDMGMHQEPPLVTGKHHGSWYLAGLFWSLWAVASSLADGLTLPKPDMQINPSGPPEWHQHPGGEGFPAWRDEIAPGVPAIGFQTDMTFPNETIAVLGDGLAGAEFVLWAEGLLMSVPALRSAKDRAQIVVPTTVSKSTSSVSRQVPKSVMLLWPGNSKGYGYPVRLNAPTVFWVWPGKKWTADADRTLRIFGKSLSLPGREPLVVARRDNEPPLPLKIVAKTAYEVKAELPEGYAPGDYQVWVHNGTGGILGWSEPGSFRVAPNPYVTDALFAVDDQAGASDQEKIVNAIALAAAGGGGTVTFSERTYTLEADIVVPDGKPGSPPVVLKGAGRDKTILKADPNRRLDLAGPGSGITDMKLVGVKIKIRSNDMTIQQIEAIASDDPLDNYHDLMPGGPHPRQHLNLNVIDSIFRADDTCCSLGSASFIRFSGCQFFGRYFDGVHGPDGTVYAENLDNHGISLRSCHETIVEGCRFQSEDALNGKIMTRGIAMLHSADSHHVFANNTFEWIGAFPSSIKRDTNTGEVILYHGSDPGLTATVDSADWESVTVNRPIKEFAGNDFETYTSGRAIELKLVMVCVASGPAAGQFRLLKSVSASGPDQDKTTLHVPRWQHVLPTPGDKIVVRPVFNQHLILNNLIDSVPDPSKVNIDFNRTGILLWVATHDTVIAGNTIRHQREAIRIQASTADSRLQASNHIRGNTLADCLPGGPNSLYSKFYADIGGGLMRSKDQFYAVGNVFRDNRCDGAEMGVEIGSGDHNRITYPRDDKLFKRSAKMGLVHSIVENNRITGVTGTPERSSLGLTVSLPANWTLLRNNKMDSYPNIDFYRPEKIFEALYINGTQQRTSEQAAMEFRN